MPTFLIIIIEIFVRLLIVLLLAGGAYAAFTAKKRHRFWGCIAAICMVSVVLDIFIPSSYTPDNRFTFSHTYTPKQAESKKKAKQLADKKAASESVEKAIKAKKAKRAAAIAEQKSKTGINGLKKSVTKALKNNGIQTYKVKVLGIDTSKPYTANIFLDCTNVSGFKYNYTKSDAIFVVSGIKKMNYKDFSKIGIIFTASTIDKYGNETKDTPLLKYHLKRDTISKINPHNIQDLEPVADYYWQSQISDKNRFAGS